MEILDRLSLSKFRSSFKLNEKDLAYIKKVGLEKIKEHAILFLNERVKDHLNPKDGKQTPFKGHPVFKGMHACACCCRGCIEKWHHIKKDHELSDNEINYLVNIIMAWINRQIGVKK